MTFFKWVQLHNLQKHTEPDKIIKALSYTRKKKKSLNGKKVVPYVQTNEVGPWENVVPAKDHSNVGH